MKRVTVRGFGYSVTHRADVPEHAIERMSWLGAEFDGLFTPIMGVCGQRVRSVQPAVIVLPADRKVTCSHCRRVPAEITTAARR